MQRVAGRLFAVTRFEGSTERLDHGEVIPELDELFAVPA
jgi:hypothetical protein